VLVGTTTIEKSERLSQLLMAHGIPHDVLNAKQHEREAAIAAAAGQPGAVTIATNMAGRGTDIVLGEAAIEAGGLHVIGTERHESRRIDDQLRGRAGRQGDPGSSRFFISLEDHLMGYFGPATARIRGLMERLEVEPIEHNWVAGSIETAQMKIEGMNFDSRRRMIAYDDVLNNQREVIYRDRRMVLEGADARSNIIHYMRDVIQKGVEAHCEGRHPQAWDLEGLLAYLGTYFPISAGTTIPEDEVRRGRDGLVRFLHQAAITAYQAKEAQLGDEELCRAVERFVILRTIDQKWRDHLSQIEHLREDIGVRAYGQRDPLPEYRDEAFAMFSQLTDAIQADIVANMFRVQVMPQENPGPVVHQPDLNRQRNGSSPRRGGRDRPHLDFQPEILSFRVMEATARNSPCWCGSGRTFKRCHGRQGRLASETLSTSHHM
jgi:preprotein translocase subunit SecA